MRPQLAGELMLCVTGLLEAHELGDILDPVDDVGHLRAGAEDRRVDRTPEPLLESAAVRFGLADTGRLRVGGVVREYVEQTRPRIAARSVMVARR